MKASIATSDWLERGPTPNSAACFTALMVSAPALARPTIFAREARAWSSREDRSLVPSGCRAPPSTLPPRASMKAVESRTMPWPSA